MIKCLVFKSKAVLLSWNDCRVIIVNLLGCKFIVAKVRALIYILNQPWSMLIVLNVARAFHI